MTVRPAVAGPDTPRAFRRAARAVVLAAALALGALLLATPAAAAGTGIVPVAQVDAAQVDAAQVPALLGTVVDPVAPAPPVSPVPPTDEASVTLDINGVNGQPSTSVVVLIGITLLSVAPSLLLMMTSFTKIFVVLTLTRNALGLTGVPPNQVLAGLALFLSLFIMSPVLSEVNDTAVQPYLEGEQTFSEAVEVGSGPLREFMLEQTREEDLALVTRAAELPNPESPETVEMTTLIPAFMLSELRSAFIIGFVIFVPFLVIDLVVSSSLMSMGMMMLPPVMVSLPFKLLLFVLVDGWGLVVTALVGSYG